MTDDRSATIPAGMFEALEQINQRPQPYSRYTADALWTSPDISEMMLRFHLDGSVDLASRRTAFIESSVDWINARFELGPGKRVIDLGCGPGLYTNRLARSGAAVTGIDFAELSVDHARAEAAREGLTIDYVVGDYLAFETDERFDLAMVIMCDYCALSPEQRARLIERVRQLLEPGGAFLFGRLFAGVLRHLGGTHGLRSRADGRFLVGSRLLRLPRYLHLSGREAGPREVRRHRAGMAPPNTSIGSSTMTQPA